MTRPAAIIAAIVMLTTAASAQAGQRNASGTATGANGNSVSCDHYAGQGQSGTNCTGSGGKSASTNATTTKNDDGSVTRSRNGTGPQGKSSGGQATFSRNCLIRFCLLLLLQTLPPSGPRRTAFFARLLGPALTSLKPHSSPIRRHASRRRPLRKGQLEKPRAKRISPC